MILRVDIKLLIVFFSVLFIFTTEDTTKMGTNLFNGMIKQQ